MSTLIPLFTDDLEVTTSPAPAPQPKSQPQAIDIPETPTFATPEDALGRANLLLVGPEAGAIADLLRERAIAERLNLVPTPAAANRLLDARLARSGVSFIPSVLVVDFASRAVERVAALGPKRALTVVLAVDDLSEVEGWNFRAFEVFETAGLAVAA